VRGLKPKVEQSDLILFGTKFFESNISAARTVKLICAAQMLNLGHVNHPIQQPQSL